MAFKKFYVSQPDTNNAAQLQRTINTIQQNVEDEFNALNKITLLNNVVIEDINISTGTRVDHKLGRKPVGYIIISKNGNATIWNGEMTDTTIILNSSAAITASVLVF